MKSSLLAKSAGASKRRSRRVYARSELSYESERGLLRALLVVVEKIVMGAAAEVVVNSQSLLAEVVGVGLARPRKGWRTLPGSHGVDSEHFALHEPDRALVASFWGSSQSRV